MELGDKIILIPKIDTMHKEILLTKSGEKIEVNVFPGNYDVLRWRYRFFIRLKEINLYVETDGIDVFTDEELKEMVEKGLLS